MKKLIGMLFALLLISAAHAQAPKLKNMLPNSYQKLARLSERMGHYKLAPAVTSR